MWNQAGKWLQERAHEVAAKAEEVGGLVGCSLCDDGRAICVGGLSPSPHPPHIAICRQVRHGRLVQDLEAHGKTLLQVRTWVSQSTIAIAPKANGHPTPSPLPPFSPRASWPPAPRSASRRRSTTRG